VMARSLEPHAGWDKPDQAWLQGIRTAALDKATAALDALLEKLKSHTLIYRDAGEVVHELRGSPNDIWQLLLSTLERE